MLWLKSEFCTGPALIKQATSMNELEELIERTKWVQEQVSALQQAFHQLQGGLLTADPGTADQTAPAPNPGGQAAGTIEADEHANPGDDDQERRALPRRRGHPVAVLICTRGAHDSASQGWVVDRSPEGLCLVTEKPFVVSTWIRVRSTDHPRGSQWFEVEVRNCRPERNIWIVGCQFRAALSWSELRELT